MKKLIVSLLLTTFACLVHADLPSVYGTPGLYDTYMTAFGKFDMSGVKLFFEPADEAISPDNLEYQEYIKYISAYFIMWGAKKVDNINDADMFVLVDYGVGETKPLVYHNPIYGRTGISSQRTTYYKNSSYTSYSYSTGVVGYDTQEVEQFRKHIDLYVYEKTENDNPKPVWQANIVCTSNSSNLAKAIPVMMWNVRFWIGSKSNGDLRQFPCSIYGHEWADNFTYNQFSDVINDFDIVPWHGFATDWTYWGKTDKTFLYPSVFYQGKEYSYVIFYCPVCDIYPLTEIYKYKIPSDTYIEYNGKKYKALLGIGCELDKKNTNYMQRTFIIRFERVPDEIVNQKISIYSDVKGKRKYGWENIYVY